MSISTDVRYGLRQLLKAPGLTAVTLLTLALGIGANTAIFSVAKGILFETAPYDEVESLMWIGEHSEQVPNMSVAYPNFLDWRERTTSFEALAAHRYQSFNLTNLERPEQLYAVYASASLFDRVLRVQPVLGRTFSAEEDQPGQGAVVVVSYGFWQTRLGGQDDALGRTLVLDGDTYEVIGVMPPGFVYPLYTDQVQMWLPIGHIADEGFMKSRGNHPGIYVTGRLAPEVSFERGRDELSSVAAALAGEYPETNTGNGVAAAPLREFVIRQLRPAVMTLAGAVVLVLLIACVNVANLLLARGAARVQEMSVRSAIGASRWQVIRQLLTESLLLALCGAVLGVLVAKVGLQVLMASIDPQAMPVVGSIEIDTGALLFTLGLAVLTGLLFGLAPAVQAARLDLVSGLKEGTKTSENQRRQRFKSALVIAQVTLAMVLLVGAMLFIKSFLRLVEADPGFDSEGVLSFNLSLSPVDYADDARKTAFFEAFLDDVRALPGVESAAATLPLLGGWQTTFVVEGQPKPALGEQRSVDITRVSSDYFATLGVDLQKGRPIDAHDTADSALVAIVDRTFADTLFPGQNPIGKRVKLSGDPSNEEEPWRTVVGVVDHVKNYGVAEDSRVELYVPASQMPYSQSTIVVKASLDDPMTLMPSIEQALSRLDPKLPAAFARLLAETTAEQTLAGRLLAGLLSAFAGLAVVLAALGIYGVMAFQVAQRRQEIGVRMALGADQGHIARLVAGRGLKLTSSGIGLGFLIAFFGGPWLASQLFGVQPRDPATLIVVPCLLLLAGLLACLPPLIRASRVEPVQALRYE